MGTEVYRQLTGPLSDHFAVVGVGVRDVTRTRPVSPPNLTNDLESLVLDTSPDVVIELMGGLDPADYLIRAARDRGSKVVTANKAWVAQNFEFVRNQGDCLLYEAAVCAGIPVVSSLKTLAKTNRINRISGIVNGSTNFILGLVEQGQTYPDALLTAMQLGYVEADPSSDIDGWDALYKIAILGGIVTGSVPEITPVPRMGIGGITAEVVAEALSRGNRIKLIAKWDLEQGISVGPLEVPMDSPFGETNGSQNIVIVNGDLVGELCWTGKGAGGKETASGVLGDLMKFVP